MHSFFIPVFSTVFIIDCPWQMVNFFPSQALHKVFLEISRLGTSVYFSNIVNSYRPHPRGHLQTKIFTLNVIVTLKGGGVFGK